MSSSEALIQGAWIDSEQKLLSGGRVVGIIRRQDIREAYNAYTVESDVTTFIGIFPTPGLAKEQIGIRLAGRYR